MQAEPSRDRAATKWIRRIAGRSWKGRALRLGAAGLLVAGVAAGATLQSAHRRAARTNAVEEKGIDRVRVMHSGAGHFLDLRFRVTDASRAAPLLARGATIALVHEASGTRLEVPSTPKTGPLKNTGEPVNGRSYFALFTNTRGVVKPGDRVSFALNDVVVQTLVVE